jgi:choline kinase
MVKTAVILAAGRGTRLKELGKEIPKGFLQLGEKPIIVESLEKLSAVGIERVVIVTGHCAEKYEELARSGNSEAEIQGQTETQGPSDTGTRSSARANLPRIVTVHNDRYADSGSLYSLYLAGKVLERENGAGFLLLESDLVYESRALRVLQDDPRPDLILVSGITNSGDEVWVQTEGGNLRALSKDRSKLERLEAQARPEPGSMPKSPAAAQARGVAEKPGDSTPAALGNPGSLSPEALRGGAPGGHSAGDATEILGELVGISKISMGLYAELSKVAEGLFQKSLHVEYETGLMETAKRHPIPCLLIPDLLWAEIDDANHLERAKGLYRRLS